MGAGSVLRCSPDRGGRFMSHSVRASGTVKRRCVAMIFILGSLALACGGGDPDTPPAGSASPREDAAAETPEASSAPAEETDALVSTSNYRFSPAELAMPAGSPSTLTYINNDPTLHNLSIYESKGGKKLFEGEMVDGESKTVYEIPALDAGKYHYQC